MHMPNWILVFKQMFYHKLHPISLVKKLKVYNYPLVKRLVYKNAIQGKEFNAYIFKKAVFGSYLNSYFMSVKAIN